MELINKINQDKDFKIPRCKGCSGKNVALKKCGKDDKDTDIWLKCNECGLEVDGTRTNLTNEKDAWGLPGLKEFVREYNGVDKIDELNKRMFVNKKYRKIEILIEKSGANNKWELCFRGEGASMLPVAYFANYKDVLTFIEIWEDNHAG